jgi:hypothetical protein
MCGRQKWASGRQALLGCPSSSTRRNIHPMLHHSRQLLNIAADESYVKNVGIRISVIGDFTSYVCNPSGSTSGHVQLTIERCARGSADEYRGPVPAAWLFVNGEFDMPRSDQ